MGEDFSREASPSETQNPVPLSYATPSPKETASDEFEKVAEIARRLIFALGAGLFMCGVGNGWMEYDKGDVGAYMGWGAGLMALMWRWRLMRQRPSEK